ncbi:hypothetical protein REPUB_Repub13aG0042800 [Reevesia pubescens]
MVGLHAGMVFDPSDAEIVSEYLPKLISTGGDVVRLLGDLSYFFKVCDVYSFKPCLLFRNDQVLLPFMKGNQRFVFSHRQKIAQKNCNGKRPRRILQGLSEDDHHQLGLEYQTSSTTNLVEQHGLMGEAEAAKTVWNYNIEENGELQLLSCSPNNMMETTTLQQQHHNNKELEETAIYEQALFEPTDHIKSLFSDQAEMQDGMGISLSEIDAVVDDADHTPKEQVDQSLLRDLSMDGHGLMEAWLDDFCELKGLDFCELEEL